MTRRATSPYLPIGVLASGVHVIDDERCRSAASTPGVNDVEEIVVGGIDRRYVREAHHAWQTVTFETLEPTGNR